MASSSSAPKYHDDEGCVVEGLCCYYSGLTTECGCRAHQEFLCFRGRINLECCSDEYQNLSVGANCSPLESSSICKIGLGFCEQELIEPRVLCGYAGHKLCFRSAGSLPMHKDFIDRLVFGLYFVQCVPDLACCATPPPCPVLGQMKANYIPAAESERMERGDYDMVRVPTAHVLSVENPLNHDTNDDSVFELDGAEYQDMPISTNKMV